MYEKTIPLQVVRAATAPLDDDSPHLRSSLGSVRCLPKNTKWPVYKKKPMFPVCQFNLTEIETKPSIIKGLEFIWIFAPYVSSFIEIPFHGNWVSITATSSKGIIPIKPLLQAGEPTQLSWLPLTKETADDMPADGSAFVKLGGHPAFTQSLTPWEANAADQLLQIDSFALEELGDLGDSAVLYAFRDRKKNRVWLHSESC